jgi:hypothetical protein
VKLSLRPVMIWGSQKERQAESVIRLWKKVLNPGCGDRIEACVYATPSVIKSSSQAVDLCWHQIDMPDDIDSYQRTTLKRKGSHVWGQKSGPNYQFFQVLKDFYATHETEWLLLLEPDVLPFGGNVHIQIRNLVTRNPRAWVVGGKPHPLLLGTLAPDLHNHLNGVALYRVGSRSFDEFRRTVWIPSLIEKLKREQTFAFDCLTDPCVQEGLTPWLRETWFRFQHKFVYAPGIVNISTKTINDFNRLVRLLGEASLLRDLGRNEEEPWLVHAKGNWFSDGSNYRGVAN